MPHCPGDSLEVSRLEVALSDEVDATRMRPDGRWIETRLDGVVLELGADGASPRGRSGSSPLPSSRSIRVKTNRLAGFWWRRCRLRSFARSSGSTLRTSDPPFPTRARYVRRPCFFTWDRSRCATSEIRRPWLKRRRAIRRSRRPRGVRRRIARRRRWTSRGPGHGVFPTVRIGETNASGRDERGILYEGGTPGRTPGARKVAT